MKVKSHLILPAIMMIVALFAVISTALRVIQVASWNSDLRNNYFNNGGSEYIAGNSIPVDWESAGLTPANATGYFTLSEPLDYYDEPNGEVVLTLEPGNYLSAWHESLPDNDDYGERSYPAPEKGWRYAHPFVKDGEQPGEKLFVKTDDLRDASELIYSGGSALVTVELTIGDSTISKEMYEHERALLLNDIAYYGKGKQYCADLEEPLFDTRTAFTGIAGLLLVGWSIVVFVVRNREENARIAAEQTANAEAHAEAKAKHDEWMRNRAEQNRNKNRKKK